MPKGILFPILPILGAGRRKLGRLSGRYVPALGACVACPGGKSDSQLFQDAG
jgi:hypothetical protein